MFFILFWYITGLICQNGIYKIKINNKLQAIDYKYLKMLHDCDPLDVTREREILFNISLSNKYNLHPDDYN